MIRAEFFGKPPKGFRVSGHSMSAPAGEDIICAAVTSAVRYAETMINDVCGAEAAVTVDEKAAVITLKLPDGAPESAGLALEALRRYLSDLAREVPEYVGVRVRK